MIIGCASEEGVLLVDPLIILFCIFSPNMAGDVWGRSVMLYVAWLILMCSTHLREFWNCVDHEPSSNNAADWTTAISSCSRGKRLSGSFTVPIILRRGHDFKVTR